MLYRGHVTFLPKATLLNVARTAGVSRSTVSNVFAHPERVKAEVRKAVERAAVELGYLGPDPKGRLLRSGKVNAIGIIPPGQWGLPIPFAIRSIINSSWAFLKPAMRWEPASSSSPTSLGVAASALPWSMVSSSDASVTLTMWSLHG